MAKAEKVSIISNAKSRSHPSVGEGYPLGKEPERQHLAGRARPPLSGELDLTGPEHLVGVGFRCWLAGYDTGDIACWETCWTHYSKTLGNRSAKRIVTELSYWVRALKEHTTRTLNYYPFGCKRFCQDECMAVAMIAASQHAHCPALQACAYSMINTDELDHVIHAADSFGQALLDVDQKLESSTIAFAAQRDGMAQSAAISH